MSAEQILKAVRGSFIDFTRVVENPEGIAPALRFIEDGLLLIRHGKIESLSAYEAFYLATLGGARTRRPYWQFYARQRGRFCGTGPHLNTASAAAL